MLSNLHFLKAGGECALHVNEKWFVVCNPLEKLFLSHCIESHTTCWRRKFVGCIVPVGCARCLLGAYFWWGALTPYLLGACHCMVLLDARPSLVILFCWYLQLMLVSISTEGSICILSSCLISMFSASQIDI
jgi:hypothetical protein